MIKVVLFDADGVVVTPDKVFSERMHEEHGVPQEDFKNFFYGDFQKCLVDQADLKDLLKDKVVEWKWQGTVEELLEYWFQNESKVDDRVLDIVTQLREKGIKVYVATNQEKNRTEYFKNEMKFGEIFDGIFSSVDVGYKKEQPEFFNHVLETLNVKPEEVMFWDDSEDNIESAKSLGIQAYLYNDFEEFRKKILSFAQEKLLQEIDKEL